MPNIFINNLVGIPASGKSTYCSDLLRSVEVHQQPNINVIHVCFDHFISVPESFNSTYFESKQYKKHRFDVGMLIQQIIDDINTSECNFNSTQNISNALFGISFKINVGFKSLKKYLLLIDDNMYYKSMRKQIRNIARANDVGYFCTFFQSSLEGAIERNNKRCDVLPEAHIRRMYSKFEPPDHQDEFVLMADVESANIPTNDELEEMLRRLQSADQWKVPATAVQQRTEQSDLHNIDLILRKEIQRRLKSGMGCESKDIASYASVLCGKRKHILKEIRNGNICLPHDVDDFDEFKMYL